MPTTEPRDRDTCLGLLKDPRSSHRTPSMPQSSEKQVPPSLLRGDGGWGQQGEVNTSTRKSNSSWNSYHARGHCVASTGAAKPWGQRSDIDCGVWNAMSEEDDGWPTDKAEETTEGKEWRPRDSTVDDSTVDDATMKGVDDGEETGSTCISRPNRSRLYAFNAKISGQPCSCLIKVFGSDEGTKLIQISKDSDYAVWECEDAISKRKDMKYKFVALFTNPVDGEHFLGGRWKGAPYEMVEVPSIDGKTVLLPCYSSKANARHSAAARALDCISFRSTDGEETYDMCIDQPYLDPANAPSLPQSAPVLNSTNDSMMTENENGTSNVAEDRHAKPPKAQLQQYFQERYLDFESIGAYFHSFSNGDDQHMLHTSVFTDPRNGIERFACGRLVDNGKNPAYEISLEDADGNGESVDVVWYGKKKDAEHAAAAKALDCIRFRESDSSLLPRLCSDNPYSNAADAPPLPLRFQLEIETLTSETPVAIISNLKVRPLPMETEEEVAHRQEYRMSRMPER